MRTVLSTITTVAVLFGFISLHANQLEGKKSVNVKRITPVLLVKEIEPIVPF